MTASPQAWRWRWPGIAWPGSPDIRERHGRNGEVGFLRIRPARVHRSIGEALGALQWVLGPGTRAGGREGLARASLEVGAGYDVIAPLHRVHIALVGNAVEHALVVAAHEGLGAVQQRGLVLHLEPAALPRGRVFLLQLP